MPKVSCELNGCEARWNTYRRQLQFSKQVNLHKPHPIEGLWAVASYVVWQFFNQIEDVEDQCIIVALHALWSNLCALKLLSSNISTAAIKLITSVSITRIGGDVPLSPVVLSTQILDIEQRCWSPIPLCCKPHQIQTHGWSTVTECNFKSSDSMNWITAVRHENGNLRLTEEPSCYQLITTLPQNPHQIYQHLRRN